MKKYFVLFLFLIMSGCASAPDMNGFDTDNINAGDFVIRFMARDDETSKPLHIYIEGDGASFDIDGYPTKDPTPNGTMMRDLANGDPSVSVIYLARPCQYVSNDSCNEHIWTDERFGTAVIDATADAIRELAHGRPVVLIGYSGGATVAGLVTVLHHDINVKRVVTLAGNMDTDAWVRKFSYQPLTGSMSLTKYKNDFFKVSSYHFVGDKDDVIPMDITFDFINGRAPVKTLHGVDHTFKLSDEQLDMIYKVIRG